MADPTLYGPDGRPIRRRQLLREHARPALASVRQPYMLEAVAHGLTPSRLAAAIRSADAGETREMETLALEMEERMIRYGAVLGVRRRAVLGVEPAVEAASDSAEDVELADAVREIARGPAFWKMLSECLWGLGPGVSALEIQWDRSGRTWMPARYDWRDPRWFRWDRRDAHALRLLSDEDPAEGTPLEPGKWIVHVPSLRPGIPARGGLARPVSAVYVLASWGLADWAGWLEVYGRPVRMGKYGPDASEDDIATLRKAIFGIGSDAAGMIPESMSVELVEAARSSSSDAYERYERWLDEQVSIAVLGQSATTQGTPGRLGSDEAQAEVRQDILRGDCEELSATINRDLVRPWVQLNYGPRQRYPAVTLKPRDPDDTRAMTGALRMLVPLGMRVEASVVRKRLGLPDPAEGAEVLGGSGPLPSGAVARATARRRVPESVLEEIEARALDGWRPAMEPLLEQLREALENASTRDEALSRLAELAGDAGDAALPDLVRALMTATLEARGLGDARDEP